MKFRYENYFKKESLERKLFHVDNWLQNQTEDSAIFLSLAIRSSIRTSTLCAVPPGIADITLSGIMRRVENYLSSCLINCLICGLSESSSLLLPFKKFTCPFRNFPIIKVRF
jgi:hypothetical protein